MRNLFTPLFTWIALGLLIGVSLLLAADDQPYWAYGYMGPAPAAGAAPAAPAGGGAPAPVDTSMKSIAGSTAQFTRAQISDRYGPADWFPGDHPQMPPVVAQGKKPDVYACGLCHYPNGKGRP